MIVLLASIHHSAACITAHHQTCPLDEAYHYSLHEYGSRHNYMGATCLRRAHWQEVQLRSSANTLHIRERTPPKTLISERLQ